MKILENNAENITFKTPLKVTCPHCTSKLIIEEGDYRKRFSWAYDRYGKHKHVSNYMVICPCCEETFDLY